MPLCNILLFGHGRDGEVVSEDYDGSGVLFILTKTRMYATDLNGNFKVEMHALDEKVEYHIVSYTSELDGKTYLIGTEDGVLPVYLDARIRATRLEAKPNEI
ncbi:hypothetical protein [Enterobacter roggenkampii]|uniref:hypothetical protein n=1 Tax=Enterobacter roggenkampii TaxID=1812935 RepID=UPI00277C6008|nr:hypothetical protein [Enterobacter roggenkampii]